MLIIFSTGPHLSSRLLRAAMFSEWSHCGIVMPGGKTVIEASAKYGVVETPIEKFTRYGKYAIQDVPVPDEDAVYRAAEAELGKRYDWLGVSGLALVRDWEDPERWFCSELVQSCKIAGGLQDLRYCPRRITPRDLWNQPYPLIYAEGVCSLPEF